MKRTVGILLYPKVEVLDFAGPFEVFSVASELNNHELFEVFTLSSSIGAVETINGLSVNAKYSILNHPKIDILIIPGGEGSRNIINHADTMRWVEQTHQSTLLTLSICTGSMLLGSIGLLNGLEYTTHHLVFNDMEQIAPLGRLLKGKRFVESGKIYTSAGISAGIDLSLHIVKTLCGWNTAHETAKYMEYNWI